MSALLRQLDRHRSWGDQWDSFRESLLAACTALGQPAGLRPLSEKKPEKKIHFLLSLNSLQFQKAANLCFGWLVDLCHRSPSYLLWPTVDFGLSMMLTSLVHFEQHSCSSCKPIWSKSKDLLKSMTHVHLRVTLTCTSPCIAAWLDSARVYKSE